MTNQKHNSSCSIMMYKSMNFKIDNQIYKLSQEKKKTEDRDD